MGTVCMKEKEKETETPKEVQENKEMLNDIPGDVIFQGLGLEHLLNDDEYECVDLHLKSFDNLIVRVRRVEEGVWLLLSHAEIYFLHHESRTWFFVEERDGVMKGRLILASEKEKFHKLLVAICHELEKRAKDYMTHLDQFNQWRLYSKKQTEEVELKQKEHKQQQTVNAGN